MFRVFEIDGSGGVKGVRYVCIVRREWISMEKSLFGWVGGNQKVRVPSGVQYWLSAGNGMAACLSVSFKGFDSMKLTV